MKKHSMTIEQAIIEWKSKKRRMGCNAATQWFCHRVDGFYPKRLNQYTKNGDLFQHVVATNGDVYIDISPYTNLPKNYNPIIDGQLI